MLVCKTTILLFIFLYYNKVSASEAEAKKWLDNYSKEACDKHQHRVEAAWQYQTDINPATEKANLDSTLKKQKWNRNMTKEARKFNYKEFKNFDLKRRFKDLVKLGFSALPDSELEEYNKLSQEMNSIYSSASVCSYASRNNCDLRLDPELTAIMEKSRDYDELLWVWEQWRENSGKKMRGLYEDYIDYNNKIAKLNGFSDMGEYWRDSYERRSFKNDMEKLYAELEPLYKQLHAYVRKKLKLTYGTKVPREGPIPAHLLGNMWGQSWTTIADMLIPYPEENKVNVTEQLKKKGYTPLKMVKEAEKFFTCLGIRAMPQSFWDKSVFDRIPGREMVCHASAWDFCKNDDARIKMCTRQTMEDFVIVHHEMGHIVYFLLYNHLPYAYRGGANPGFHEAIGDVIALSVTTPKHLHKIGLLETLESTPKTDLNFLMTMALEKIAFLPYGYLVDAYRWKVFEGEIEKKDLNCKWWEMIQKYQGIVSPVKRTEADFDPGAKFHVAASVSFVRYFVAYILQFQFHKSLCLEAGEYDPNDPDKPLYKCDIYENKKAGKLLADTLKMGSSRPWWETLKVMTGDTEINSSAIREYFKPLEDWLIKENKKTNEKIGWETDDTMCSSTGYTPRHSAAAVETASTAYISILLLSLAYLRLSHNVMLYTALC